MTAVGTFFAISFGIIVGSAVGAYVATEIIQRRTDRWLRRTFSDKSLRERGAEWVKSVLYDGVKKFKNEFVDSGEFDELMGKLKEKAMQALLGSEEDDDLPELDEWNGGW